jgi:hypothetical protein
MKLTAKLLGALNRVFDKDPEPFLALRINYDGGLAWAVADGFLTLTVTGGTGASALYDLSTFTLQTLVATIAASAGFDVTFLDSDRRSRSALCLLDGGASLSDPNGGALLGYTSLLWAFFEAFAVELQRLRDQVANALLQMSTTTASGAWLDELGSYYGVVRMPGEVDALYSQRIIAETLRPVSNNVAIEAAIEGFTGQPCTVDDVVIYRGGSINYNTVGFPNYGLFDVTVAYDLLLGGDPTTFAATVQAIVQKLRAGGTFLRALALGAAGAPITDSLAPPTDDVSILGVTATLTDALSAPAEVVSGLAIRNNDLSDVFTAPSDAAAGSILTNITTQGGAPITDQAGNPLQARGAPLFI